MIFFDLLSENDFNIKGSQPPHLVVREALFSFDKKNTVKTYCNVNEYISSCRFISMF